MNKNTKKIVIVIVVVALLVAAYIYRDKIKALFAGKKNNEGNDDLNPKLASIDTYTPASTSDTTQNYTSAQTSGAYTAPANNDSEVLAKGSRGNNVKRLQTLLNKYGFNSGTVDGIFGDKTETALKKAVNRTSVTVDELNKFETYAKKAESNGKTAATIKNAIAGLPANIAAPLAYVLTI